jgi:hypothetical protein
MPGAGAGGRDVAVGVAGGGGVPPEGVSAVGVSDAGGTVAVSEVSPGVAVALAGVSTVTVGSSSVVAVGSGVSVAAAAIGVKVGRRVTSGVGVASGSEIRRKTKAPATKSKANKIAPPRMPMRMPMPRLDPLGSLEGGRSWFCVITSIQWLKQQGTGRCPCPVSRSPACYLAIDLRAL